MENPLQRLLVDSAEVDAEMLATLLEPYVRIDRASAEMRGTSQWTELTIPQKVVASLLTRKAMVALDIIQHDDEAVAPQDIERTVGVRGGTLRKAVSTLYHQRVLEKEGSRYFVPGYAVGQAKRIFERRSSS